MKTPTFPRSLFTLPRPASALAATLVFLACSAFAAADVAVTLSAPSSGEPGQTISWTATVENRGPDAAHDVEIITAITFPPCVETKIETLAAGEKRSFPCDHRLTLDYSTSAGRYVYGYEIFVRANVPGTADPVLSNNLAIQNVDLITDPDLWIAGNAPVRAATPGLAYSQTIEYANYARTAATGVEISIRAPGAIVKAPELCTIRGSEATCRLGRLEPVQPRWAWSSGSFAIEFIAPDASERNFETAIAIRSAENDVDPRNNQSVIAGITYRTIYVTNANDSGSGSLRQAIDDANASCVATMVPCKVAFRIPDAQGPWQTIHLRTPLPFVTADNLAIDASTQAAYFADTNPAGPEVELDGSALGEGDGFRIESPCEMEVRGFAINRFPRYGVYALARDRCPTWYGSPRIVRDNYIGTDPTGMYALPNMRGVVIEADPQTATHTITGNLISGNLRAGVFIQRATQPYIAKNIIGLNRTLTAPLGNGASGIYLSRLATGAEVKDNYVGFNAHAGLAFETSLLWGSATGNSFQANGGLAIDYGLDSVSDRPIPAPVITSVRVEGGQTIIEGTVETSWAFVNVYANDAPDPSGYGEGQYTLGLVETQSKTFRFVYPADLRGKWIAATTTRIEFYGLAVQGSTATTTSEFGRAVEVK